MQPWRSWVSDTFAPPRESNLPMRVWEARCGRCGCWRVQLPREVRVPAVVECPGCGRELEVKHIGYALREVVEWTQAPTYRYGKGYTYGKGGGRR